MTTTIHAATLYTVDGDIITQGLDLGSRSDQALKIARREAAERGEMVVLHDYDGWWTVRPDGSCEERPAPPAA